MPQDALTTRQVTFIRVRPTAALLLTLALPLLAGCGSKMQTAMKVQDTLTEAYRHAQVDPSDAQARVWADKAVALAPKSPATYFGDPEATVPGPQIGIATVFGAVGDDAALADYMAQAVQKFPNDERGYQLLMDAQDRLGRDAARKATAAALVPLLTRKLQTPGARGLAELTVALAQAQFAAGDPAGGAATYTKAIGAYPNDSNPPNGLAYAYALANTHLPEALGLAQKALAIAQRGSGPTKDAEVAAIQDTLAWVQYRRGDYKDAEQNLLEAVSYDPRRPEMRLHLGQVYAAQGRTDAARAELGHAVLLSPGYAAAQSALARLPKVASS